MAILYEKKGKIAYVTINRPDARNAIDPETNDELARAWADFRDDPDLWVAILSGAGDKAFCAGADLKKMIPLLSSMSDVERRHRLETQPGFGGLTRNMRIWKPIIAAINGACLAGGLEIALCCDLRVAAEQATFGLFETRWGLIPGAGGTQRLPRAVPLCKAMEMILLAEPIDAQEAWRIGLVNRVVPSDQVMLTAEQWARTICERGPLAVRAAKAAMLRGVSLPLEEGLAIEAMYREQMLKSEDAVEGPKAFAEKRKPEFKCR